MTKTLFPTLLFALLISCHTTEREDSFNDSSNKTINISPTLLDKFPNDSLGKPEYLYAWKNKLLITDPSEGQILSYYDIENNDFQRFIQKGSGPEELMDVQQIGKFDEKRLFVKSTFGSKLFLYDLKQLTPNEIKTLNTPFTSLSVDNNLLIGPNTEGDNRFIITNKDQKVTFGNTIEPYTQEIAAKVLQGLSVNSPDAKRLAWFSYYGEAAEFYDYSDINAVNSVKQYIGELPIVDEQYIMNPNSILGVTSLTKSSKYVFALYNGQSLMEILKTGSPEVLSDKILVYDWNGNQLATLNSDKKIRSIAYDEYTDVVYFLAYDSSKHEYTIDYLDKIENYL